MCFRIRPRSVCKAIKGHWSLSLRILLLIPIALALNYCTRAPRKSDLAAIKSQYAEAEGMKFELSGIVLFPAGEPILELKSKASGKELSWFSFRDSTETGYIWFDPAQFPRPPRGGDQINLVAELAPASIEGVPFGGIAKYFLQAKKIVLDSNVTDSPGHVRKYFFEKPLGGPQGTVSVRFLSLRECNFTDPVFYYSYDRFYGEVDRSLMTPKRIESQILQYRGEYGDDHKYSRSDIAEIRLVPTFDSGQNIESIESVEIYLKDGSKETVSPSGDLLLNPIMTGLIDAEEEEKARITGFGLYGKPTTNECRNYGEVNLREFPKSPEYRFGLPARIVFH